MQLATEIADKCFACPARLTYAEAAQRLVNPRPCGGSLRGECPLCGHPDALSLRAFARLQRGTALPHLLRVPAPVGEIVRALRNGEAEPRAAPKLRTLTPEQKAARVRAIWRGSVALEGTIAEKYLRETRGVSIPSIGPAIRYRPGCLASEFEALFAGDDPQR